MSQNNVIDFKIGYIDWSSDYDSKKTEIGDIGACYIDTYKFDIYKPFTPSNPWDTTDDSWRRITNEYYNTLTQPKQPVRVAKKDNLTIIEALVPGIDESDITVKLFDLTLSILTKYNSDSFYNNINYTYQIGKDDIVKEVSLDKGILKVILQSPKKKEKEQQFPVGYKKSNGKEE